MSGASECKSITVAVGFRYIFFIFVCLFECCESGSGKWIKESPSCRCGCRCRPLRGSSHGDRKGRTQRRSCRSQPLIVDGSIFAEVQPDCQCIHAFGQMQIGLVHAELAVCPVVEANHIVCFTQKQTGSGSGLVGSGSGCAFESVRTVCQICYFGFFRTGIKYRFKPLKKHLPTFIPSFPPPPKNIRVSCSIVFHCYH